MSSNDRFLLSEEALVQAANNEDSWPLIRERFDPLLFHWCRRRVWDLPEADHDDIVQETYFALFEKHDVFDPGRGTARQFLFGLFLNAVKKVRRRQAFPKQVKPVYLGEDATRGQVAVRDTLADKDDHIDRIVARTDAQEAVRKLIAFAEETAPLDVAKTIGLLAANAELSMAQVAGLLGKNRITLTRRLRAWAAPYRPTIAN